MRKFRSIGNYIPYPFFKYLLETGEFFGNKIDYSDPNWIEWEKTYLEFYEKSETIYWRNCK